MVFFHCEHCLTVFGVSHRGWQAAHRLVQVFGTSVCASASGSRGKHAGTISAAGQDERTREEEPEEKIVARGLVEHSMLYVATFCKRGGKAGCHADATASHPWLAASALARRCAPCGHHSANSLSAHTVQYVELPQVSHSGGGPNNAKKH